VAWKTPLPGIGSSTPVIWGEQLFITAGIAKDAKSEDAPRHDAVVAYGMDGVEQWRVLLGPEKAGKHRNGSGSNPSPVTDGKHLFVYYKSGTVAALDLSGKLVWRANLQELYGEDTLWWDLGSSPALTKDHVVIAVMQEGESYLVAMEKASGKIGWKTARNYECRKETDQSYATPIIIDQGGKEEIVTWGADHLTSHQASDGKLVWQCGGFNPKNEAMWRVIATPAITNNIALVPYGRTKFLAAVQLGGEGDITKTARLWEKEGVGSDVPSPVAKDGVFYLLADNGWLHSFEATSGQERWKGQLPRSSSKYYSSPVLANDVLYCAREDGFIFTVRLKDSGFDLLGENDMGEGVIATLIPVNNQLIIRGAEHLFCIKDKS
ncbi:MAG: outer membrane protein assembly factor BamB family protein, partial [Verrucomicrobiales bacterium]